MTMFWAACFGLAFGSFVAAAIDRIAAGRSINGRSCCDACGRQLAARELVPVLSYLALRGRCSTCDAKIGVRSALIEVGTAVAFAAAFSLLASPMAVIACVAFVTIVMSAGVGWKKRSVAR